MSPAADKVEHQHDSVALGDRSNLVLAIRVKGGNSQFRRIVSAHVHAGLLPQMSHDEFATRSRHRK